MTTTTIYLNRNDEEIAVTVRGTPVQASGGWPGWNPPDGGYAEDISVVTPLGIVLTNEEAEKASEAILAAAECDTEAAYDAQVDEVGDGG